MWLVLVAVIIGLCTLAVVAKFTGPAKSDLWRSTNILVVLGSGGHTAEMLTLLQKLKGKEGRTRSYVVAATDQLSAQKAQRYEEAIPEGSNQLKKAAPGATVYKIPRSREVGQSYVTSIWTTLVAILAALQIVLKSKPDLVLVNGPGTCIPICLAAFIFRCVSRWHGQIVYIESIARVNSLSLSGNMLYHLRIADLFLVQWPKLQQIYPQSRYCGRLY